MINACPPPKWTVGTPENHYVWNLWWDRRFNAWYHIGGYYYIDDPFPVSLYSALGVDICAKNREDRAWEYIRSLEMSSGVTGDKL